MKKYYTFLLCIFISLGAFSQSLSLSGELDDYTFYLKNNTEVDFLDGEKTIPACYYEFALRYPKADGKLFKGFVTTSADKIFESTNKGQSFKQKEQ